MKRQFFIIIFAVVSLLINSVYAQKNSIMSRCTEHLQSPFISDGQQYKAILNNDELAEFHVTFFGGSLYRIACCTSAQKGDIIFSLYDRERNLLYTNREYNNAPYWDFKFDSTVDCIIEAELSETENNSGFAILLIGFKQ